jgi:hypothetical protein
VFRRARPVAVLVGVGLLAGVAACGAPARAGGSTPVSATHQVTYLVQGTGRISFDVAVGYTGADGSSSTDTATGTDPLWSRQITTASSVTGVVLTAAASGGSTQSTVRCDIVVDGIQVADVSAQFVCNAQFDFAQLPALLSARPTTTSPAPSAAPSPLPVPSVAAPAAGCGFVTDDEMLAAVTGNFSAMYPSVSSSGDATSCHYHVAGDYGSDGYVTLTWAKGAKLDAQTKREWFPVPGTGVPAYASPAGDARIQAPHGVLSLSLFGYLEWDHFLAAVVAIYHAAAPRLR